MEGSFCPRGGSFQDDQVPFVPASLPGVSLWPEGGNAHDAQVRFVSKGGNSRDDQGPFGPVCLVPVHVGPEGGNSHDEQAGFARLGAQLVEHFGELDLGLVQSLRELTGQGRCGMVTDRSALSDPRRFHADPVVPGL